MTGAVARDAFQRARLLHALDHALGLPDADLEYYVSTLSPGGSDGVGLNEFAAYRAGLRTGMAFDRTYGHAAIRAKARRSKRRRKRGR